jgi:hypothetical protein
MFGGSNHRWSHYAGALRIIAALTLNAASDVSSGQLFPAHCRVVLLAGLAGDLESETTLRDQLVAWCDLAAHSGRVESLFVLSDNSDAVRLPAGVRAKAFHADRKAFLELSQALAGSTNPLVVVAWGHGGKVGATPVFHVRGPRLTPDDFLELARHAGADSNWVLLFRGSGAFARPLAGEGRQVLSSDCAEEFGTDPITMSLLLKIVRHQADNSFQDLAAELGRTTQAWYDERHLSVAEAPAFWSGTDKPRLVATVEKTEPTNSLPDIAAQGGAEPPAAIESQPTRADEARPAWRDLPRVKTGEYPEADAVILRQRLACRVGHNPAVLTEQDEFIQILTPRGKEYGDFDVSYSPPEEELEFVDCEVMQPDGRVVRLDPDMIGEARQQPPGDYEGPRRKRFSLPGVVPGAIVHVHYRSQWKTFPLPQVSMELPLGAQLPCVNATVQVSVPKESPFHFAVEEIAAPPPSVEQTEYGSSYVWQFTNMPAARGEVLQKPRHHPRLAFSTFSDWKSFAGWFDRISRLTEEVTPEISAKALELTRDATTEHDKVLALYNYVTGLRYVAVPLGVNSFRPHAAANVQRNQFGDCKDKANLFNALLRSIKIDAQLVLVPRFGQAHETVPGLAFNHAISRLTLGGQTIWADTTDDICRFGFLPPGDPGRNVLVLGDDSVRLTQLPFAEPKQNRLAIRGSLDCTREPMPMKLKVVAEGYPDYELRAAARQLRGPTPTVPLLGVSYRPFAGVFALNEQAATAVDALNESFAWNGQGASVGICSKNNQDWRLHSPVWIPKEWDLALHGRRSGLFLNKGYPLTLDEEFEITLPVRAETPLLPAVCTDTQGPLRWRIEWASITDGKLAARFHAELERGELSESDTVRFQQQLRALLTGLGTQAAFAVPDQIVAH